MGPAETPATLDAQIWRAVASHLELGALFNALQDLLGPRLGVVGLTLLSLSPGASVPRVLASTAAPGNAPEQLALDATELKQIAARLSDGLRGVPQAVLRGPRRGVDCAVLDLGLDDAGARQLCVVFAASLSRAIGEVSALLDPLRVALGHDRVIHELARRRDAAEADNVALRARVPAEELHQFIVGERGGLREVMEQVGQVARTDVPVLILGETGSGKEVVARAVHGRSPRAKGPFLKVNCGAIPPELVDSELFGHEKGSFTGAASTRQGWFERADGGTLFLDELGELPAAAQVRLLRVLQDGEFERVGGQRTLRVSLRIVAATHRDMRDLLHSGRFREDLWYRIAVFPIRLPPLRERLDDVEPLARHFAERAGQKLYTQPLTLTREDLDLLRAYPWPGNVRELSAVIDRAAILGYGRRLEIGAALGVGAPPPPRSDRPMDTLNLEDANREAIELALRRTKGKIEGAKGAAAVLGINPHTLRARMRKLGIEWAGFRDDA